MWGVCEPLGFVSFAVDEAFEYVITRLTKNTVDVYPEFDDLEGSTLSA